MLVDLQEVHDSVPIHHPPAGGGLTPDPGGRLERCSVSASIGVSFYPQAEDTDADQLLRQADQAMYQAKLAGKNRYHLFDAEQDRSMRVHTRKPWSAFARRWLIRSLCCYYQPRSTCAPARWLAPRH